jgi:tetratricopeptide (TPR) repeat protein
MKNMLLLLAGVLLFTASYAQKGNVTKAESLLNKGDVAAAKAEIDVAVTIEKNASKSKTFLTKGKIYKAIATSEDPAVSGLMGTEQAIAEASESLKKAMAMESEGSVNYNFAEYEVEDFWSKYLNTGGEIYGEEDYKGAYENFYKASLIKPTDSLTLFYAGVAAQQAELTDEAMAVYYKLIEQGDANEDIYSTMVYLERSEKKNDAAALALLEKAKVAYPENADFMREEINILIAMKKGPEAIEKLKGAIEKEPDNASLYLNLAVLYDNLSVQTEADGNTTETQDLIAKAQTNYEKALAIEPGNYVGNFNLGVIWVNRAKVYYDKARAMDLKTYQKEGGKLVEEGDKVLAKSLPYLEAAHTAEPEDCSVMGPLMSVYTQLKKNAKAEEIADAQDAAGCN